MYELLYVSRDRDFPRQHVWVDYHYGWAHSPDRSESQLDLARLAEAELKILHVTEELALVSEAELKI